PVPGAPLGRDGRAPGQDVQRRGGGQGDGRHHARARRVRRGQDDQQGGRENHAEVGVPQPRTVPRVPFTGHGYLSFIQRNVLRHRIKLPMSQAVSTSATFPSSQLCADSAASSESGRSAARSPWHSHLSGNSAATVCIPLGRLLKGKYTPEMNCSTRYGRFSTAAALRLERGTLLTAMPSIVQVATPSRKTQVKVTQRSALLGSLSP